MDKRTAALLACGLLLLAPFAFAEAAVYVYVDTDGTSHFTDAPTRPDFRPLPAFGVPPGANLTRGQYADLINAIALEHDVDPALVKAIIRTESNFDPRALSRKGARGLMQLMPGTAGRYAVANSFDPEENIRGGVRYLRALHDMFPGRLPLVLAAYNAGENAVLRHDGIPPYPETRDYVARVLKHYGGREKAPSDSGIGRAGHTQVVQAAPSTPSVFRREEADGTPFYTNIPPLVRSAERSLH